MMLACQLNHHPTINYLFEKWFQTENKERGKREAEVDQKTHQDHNWSRKHPLMIEHPQKNH